MAMLASLAAAGYRVAEVIKVRWSEIDAQRIVFNGHYMTYLDEAITEYLRLLGRTYGLAPLDIVLARATQQFRAPAREGDILHVGARCARLGRSSITMHFEIRRQSDEALILEAEFVYVNVDLESGQSRPLSTEARQALLAFDAPADG